MNTKPAQIFSRIAPTPSGYLHIGNAYNFLLTWWITKSLGGKLWLRIDDADTGRRRDEYLKDIFDSLDWLGIDIDLGPKSIEDFLQNHSQSLKTERYFEAIKKTKDIFACDCSRKKIKENASDGNYPGTCRERKLSLERGTYALRIKTPPEMDDFVIWRKDDVPAYQLTSVMDDHDMGVNLIVRGEDLKQSSTYQIYLAQKLGLDFLAKTKFIHHPLVLDKEGQKLSKSKCDTLSEIHLKSMREAGEKPEILLKRFAQDYGIEKAQLQNAGDLLSYQPPFSDVY